MSQLFQVQETTHQLTYFFSSYLNDLSRTIAEIKSLVFSLIHVSLPQPPPLQVAPNSLSIAASCRRSFDDLKKIESLLRGHVKAKSIQIKNRSRTSLYWRFAEQQIDRNPSSSCIVESGGAVGAKKSSLSKGKIESASTFMSRLTEQQSQQNYEGLFKNVRNATVTFEQPNNTQKHESEAGFKKERDCVRQQSGSRVKTIQLAEKIEQIRESRAKDISNFQSTNKQCLSIIGKLKQQLKVRKLKGRRKRAER